MDQEVKTEMENGTQDSLRTVLSKRKKKPTLEKREMALKLKIKKCVSETTIKNVISDNRGKTRSSKSAATKCAVPKSPAMIRAEEVQSNLEASFPTFAKSMVRSHVGSCFWMGLPGIFCKLHLPNVDTSIVLEDEYGTEYQTKYIADKTGLSAGWRQFVSGHGLVEGDVLVFQLVAYTKFKVYVIRADDFAEVDGALGLLTLDSNATCDSGKFIEVRNADADLDALRCNNSKRKCLGKEPDQLRSASCLLSEDSGPESSEVLELSVSTIPFKDIRSFENFSILVHGTVIDSEFSEDVRVEYYKLCSSQDAYLHENINHGMNSKLIAGTISEIVNIAGALRTSMLTTSREKLVTWDKSLAAFELLGMNIGFLRARLRRIISLSYDSEGAAEARRYFAARTARTNAEDEIRDLEERLRELKRDYMKLDDEIEALKPKAESYELQFQEEVSAPW